MKEILCFLNNNSGALTVLVTAIYTVATIAILIANFISARAANKQITTSHKQYRDSRHLQVMPFLQASFSTVEAPKYTLLLKLCDDIKDKTTKRIVLYIENVGKGSAIDLSYTWNYSSIMQQDDLGMAVIKEESACKLELILFGELTEGENKAVLTVKYSDFLGKYYTQDLILYLKVEGFGPDDLKIVSKVPVPVEKYKKEE